MHVISSYERLSGADIRRRFPQFRVDDDMIGLYQAKGGLVDAALGNALHVQLARSHGAHVIDNCPVVKVETTKDGGARVRVT